MNVQTLFILGAMVLFTTLTLSYYQKQNMDLENKLYLEAIIVGSELGDSFLNQMTRRDFDENTIAGRINDKNLLTPSYSFGLESGEDSSNVTSFDDIDDFDGYTRLDSLDKLGIFIINVSVDYVDESSPSTIVTSNQYFKRIVFVITNTYLTDPIEFYHIVSY